MTFETAIELARALALCVLFGLLPVVGQGLKLSDKRGWPFVVCGTGLLLLGCLLDAAENFDSLRTTTFVAGIKVELVLILGFGYVLGPVLLVVGLFLLSLFVRDLLVSEARLARRTDELEKEVEARAAGAEQANRELRESEERFRGVVENSPSAIFLKDIEGRFRLVNQRFEEWYGVDADKALGCTSHEIFPESFADAYVAQDMEVLRLGRLVEREQDIVFRDGVRHSILVTKFPVMNGHGKPLGVGTINTDLTEQKRTLTALRDSENALAEAQRVARVGNWRWSVEADALVTCSEEFARLHGVGLDQIHHLVKHQLERVVHPEDRERLAEALRSAAKSHDDYKVEYRIVCPDGEVRHLLRIAKAIRDQAGNVTEYIGTIQDVTEQKLAEEALLAAKEEAELASRSKTEFLANMSHELRTPLNWIIGYAELMKNEMLGPIGESKYHEYIEDIYVGGLHLLDLIGDLLDLAQIESGNARLHEEKVELLELVTSCVKLMTERANSAGVELSLEVPIQKETQLHADPRMVKQILINLLSNAVKFTPSGGSVVVKLGFTLEREFELRVQDTGIGIAAEDIPKALGRFQQVDGQLNRKAEGSGLGLALTKSFVELHGGTLHLQSELGHGTTITVRFPHDRTLPLFGEDAHQYAAAAIGE